MNGGRVLYSHIDGDGFRTSYEANPSVVASEKILDEVLRRYPYLVTASVIVFDIESAFFGGPRMRRIAQEIFELDHVEAASHSWTHPFDWQGGLLDVPEGIGFETFPGYPERQKALDAEIGGSIDWINEHLTPDGKEVKMFLWTGAANPDTEAVAEVHATGVFNLNGGLGRLDPEFDSISWLAPLVAQPGGNLQYYATNANDNNYTGLWSGPFEGFSNVIKTYERTESPRRLTPIDVYYHYYSGSKDASLSALDRVFDWLEGQEINSVWASEYVSMVQGFLSAEIRVEDNGWLVSDFGSMRTVRFDQAMAVIDLNRSRNVVGYRVLNGSLYVFLGAGEEALVILNDNQEMAPHLEYCGCLVHARRTEQDKEVYDVNARLDTHFVLAGLEPGLFVSLEARGEAGTITADGTADEAGRAKFRIPAGTQTVVVLVPQV